MTAETSAQRTVRIRNQLGLHARPASRFVRLAGEFDAEIRVEKDAVEVNGKSVMGILMLAAEQGSELTIRAEGDDAPDAVTALCDLVDSGFEEE